MIDVQGDLPNLLLNFPTFSAAALEPWVETLPHDPRSSAELAAVLVEERRAGLAAWHLAQPELADFNARTRLRVSTAGEPLHVLSALERPVHNFASDPDAARASLSAAVSLILRLLNRNSDPASSPEHVRLSVLAEHRLRSGQPTDLASLLEDVNHPARKRSARSPPTASSPNAPARSSPPRSIPCSCGPPWPARCGLKHRVLSADRSAEYRAS